MLCSFRTIAIAIAFALPLCLSSVSSAQVPSPSNNQPDVPHSEGNESRWLGQAGDRDLDGNNVGTGAAAALCPN